MTPSRVLIWEKKMMKIIKKNYQYNEDIDVLIRVYENQSKEYNEVDQIAFEILFKPYIKQEHLRFTSRFPRGAVAAIVSVLNKFKNKDWLVQISNELPSTVGVLTSCIENFDRSLEWDRLCTSTKPTKQ